MTELEKARYNASKTAKDEKAKIKQALPIDGLLSFLEGGARPRAIVGGLLNGDTSALNGLLGEIKQLVDPNYMRNVKGMSEQDAINIALDTNPIMAGTIKGNVIDAITPKTQYELAHELAQKNAVEMLGLPPNNTAMDRAKAMGFDTPAYHGTDNDFNKFSNKYLGKNTISNASSDAFGKTSKLGHWFGDVPMAQRKTGEYSKMPGTLDMPVYLKISNPKEYNNLYELVDEIDVNGLKSVKDSLNKYDSYDAIKVLKDNETKASSYVIQNPANIRSRFAAFDPARAHKADLLGMATPEMLGLLAAGSGAGVAYANSRKNKKGNNK